MGQAPRSRAHRRRDGRRDAEAGRRRAFGDVHGDGHRHREDRRALARPQLPARDRRRLEPRRGADRDRRLGSRSRRLGYAEGHVDAAGPLVRERLARGLGAQPADRDAALLLRLEAHARRAERRRKPVHARDRDRQRARRRARPRARGGSRGDLGAHARDGRSLPRAACSPRASGSTRPTTSRARS